MTGTSPPTAGRATGADLSIDDLRVFVAVADAGSFTAAAEVTGYTQSGVSRRVAALERAAGAPLFRRLPRGVRLAPAGEALSAHATVLLEAMDAAVAAVAAVSRGTGGRLRVGSFATADAVLVPSVVADLRREAPDLTTTVTEGLTRDLVAGLRAGALDVAVVSDYPDGAVDDAGLVLEHLCDDELLVALPAGHRLAGERTIDVADLADESWIEAGRLAIDNTTVNLLAARAGFVPRTDITVPGWTAKQGFVAAGLGVTLVPRLAAAAMRADLVLRPVRDPAARRRVHVARPAGRLGEVAPTATDHFVRVARAVAARIM